MAGAAEQNFEPGWFTRSIDAAQQRATGFPNWLTRSASQSSPRDVLRVATRPSSPSEARALRTAPENRPAAERPDVRRIRAGLASVLDGGRAE